MFISILFFIILVVFEIIEQNGVNVPEQLPMLTFLTYSNLLNALMVEKRKVFSLCKDKGHSEYRWL
jgi:hypothetical protein